MKKFKLIPAVTFFLIVTFYLVLTGIYSTHEEVKTLNDNEKVELQTVFSNDTLREGISKFSKKELEIDTLISEKHRNMVAQLSGKAYPVYQVVINQTNELARYLFNGVRLMFALFLFLSSYLFFTKKMKNNVTFSQLLFNAVKLILVFCLFFITAQLVTQYRYPNEIFSEMSIQFYFFQFLKMLRVGGIYGIFISIFFYFHPHNIHRIKDKQARLERNKQKEIEKAQNKSK